MAKNKIVTKKTSTNKKQVATMVVATKVSKSIDKWTKESSPLFKIVNNFTIATVEDQAKLVDTLRKIKAYGAEAQASQAITVNAAKLIMNTTKALYEPFLTSVEDATDLGKKKILAFVNSRLIASVKVGEKFESGEIKKVSTVVAKQAELEDNDNTRKVWKLTIVDEQKIPRAYLVPDEVAIRKALKEGKKVAGCTLTQENTIAI